MENYDNIEMNASLMCISEMLERELEKDHYRSIFHGSNNCSLRLNWYSGVASRASSQGTISSRSSLKRKTSQKSVISETDEVPPKKISVDNDKNASAKQKKRRGIVSSESEDGEDTDYSIHDTSHSEHKKPKQTEISVRYSESKSKTDDVKSIPKVKLSIGRESRPTITTKVSSSITIKQELQTEVVEAPAELPRVKIESGKNPVSVSSRSGPSVTSTEPNKSASKPRSQGGVESSSQSKMMAIIRKLLADPANELFRDPVPRSCEDYYLLVENPICLRDIRRKVEGNRYRSVQGFRRDLMLIVTNCIYYNMLMNADQISNRHQAYSLHRTILDGLRDILEERCTSEQLYALAGVYSGIIEKVYGIEVNGIQLIRYFAIDNKQLTDYDHYVKRAILLRSILVCCLFVYVHRIDTRHEFRI